MRRALLAVAVLLLLARAASADRGWQEPENTNGFCSVATLSSNCVMESESDGTIACVPTAAAHTFLGWDGAAIAFSTVPAASVSSVPTGVLEGVSGAITGYSATNKFIQYGAISGGGLQQSTNLQFDGTVFYLGSHANAPQPTLQSLDINSTVSGLVSYPGSGANVANLLRVSPRGTGTGTTTAAVQVYNTDEQVGTNQEFLSIIGRGSSGFAIVSALTGAGTLRPIAIGTDANTPTQCVMNTNGTVSFGTGDLVLNKSGAQAITHSTGTMTVGTTDAQSLILKTNGSTAVTIDSTQGFTFPTFSAAGTQCAQFDNTGKLGATGAPCGSGGLGGSSGSGTVTNVTGTAPIFITGTPSVAPNVTIQGAITSGSTSTTAQNTGSSLTTGLMKANISAGVNAISTAVAGTDYQAPLTACSNYVSLSCVTGATDIGGTNATPTVIGLESDALARGDLLMTVMSGPSDPPSGFGRCWFDPGGLDFTCSNQFGIRSHGVQTSLPGGNFVVGIGDDGYVYRAGVSATQVAGLWPIAISGSPADLTQGGATSGQVLTWSGTAWAPATPTVGGITQLTNDVTAGPGSGSQVANVVAMENAALARGYIDFTAIARPSAPTGSKDRLYSSLVTGEIESMDPSGTPHFLVKDITCASSAWVNKTLSGTPTCTQPAFTDLTGSASCAQMPAFASDLSSAGGTCSVNVTAIESAGTMRGYLAANVVVAPSTPGVGVANLYVDATSDNFCSKNSLGIIDHGIQTNAGSVNKWVSAIADDGTVTLSRPDFSNLSGSATCAQLPALTGADGIASAGGTCTVTNSNKGKVLVSGTDTTINYLGSKVQSTSGNIAVTATGGGANEKVNLNVATWVPFASLNYDWGIGPATPFPSSAGYLSTASQTNFTAGTRAYETGVAAVSVRLSVNVDTNSLTGGTPSWDLTVYRNGVATAATFHFTSGTLGKQSISVAVASGAITDDYALFWVANGVGTGGTVGFTASVLVSGG